MKERKINYEAYEENRVTEPSPNFGSFLEAYRILKECSSLEEGLVALHSASQVEEEEYGANLDGRVGPAECSRCGGSGQV